MGRGGNGMGRGRGREGEGRREKGRKGEGRGGDPAPSRPPLIHISGYAPVLYYVWRVINESVNKYKTMWSRLQTSML